MTAGYSEATHHQSEVRRIDFANGALYLSAGGVEVLGEGQEMRLADFMARCQSAIEGQQAPELGVPVVLGRGSGGTTYELAPGAGIAVKVLDESLLHPFDPTIPLVHLERIREAIAAGPGWIRMPRHLGVFFSFEGGQTLLVTEQVNGKSLGDLFAGRSPDVLADCGGAAALAQDFSAAGEALGANLGQYDYGIGDLVDEWAVQYVAVEPHMQSGNMSGCTFWVLDPLSNPF